MQGDPAVSSGLGVLGTGDALGSGCIPEVIHIDVVLDRVFLGGVETVFDAVAAEPGLLRLREGMVLTIEPMINTGT